MMAYFIHPTVEDGVICLVQPPETIEHPAAVSSSLYSDLASGGSLKLSETVSLSFTGG